LVYIERNRYETCGERLYAKRIIKFKMKKERKKADENGELTITCHIRFD